MKITVNRRTYTIFGQTVTSATHPALFACKPWLKAIHYGEGVRGALVEIWEDINGNFSIL